MTLTQTTRAPTGGRPHSLRTSDLAEGTSLGFIWLGLRKPMKTVSQDRWATCQEFYPGPTYYEAFRCIC
jgi:hypothetical protein